MRFSPRTPARGAGCRLPSAALCAPPARWWGWEDGSSFLHDNKGSWVTQTWAEWPKLQQVSIAHMQRREDNYTIREHHISLRNTLRQKINFDPCARTKWGESCLFVNCFSLINCFLCDQRSNDSEKTNTDRTLIRRAACTHTPSHTQRKQPLPRTVVSVHSWSEKREAAAIHCPFKRQIATTINQRNTALCTINTIYLSQRAFSMFREL